MCDSSSPSLRVERFTMVSFIAFMACVVVRVGPLYCGKERGKEIHFGRLKVRQLVKVRRENVEDTFDG